MATRKAKGIHAHKQFKLGLKPHNVPDNELLTIHFRDDAPAIRATVDNMTDVTPGMYNNDEWGICGPTMLCNGRRINSKIETGKQYSPPQSVATKLYEQSTNPPFDPTTDTNDNGVANPDLFAAAHKYGIGSVKPVAYGRVMAESDEDLYRAIDVFGCAFVAVDLQKAQQKQSQQGFWDYSQSGDWGGHDIVFARYNTYNGSADCFSWAMPITTTPDFRSHQLGEIWVMVLPNVLASDKFNLSVNVAALKSDFNELTGNNIDDIAASMR